MKFSEADASTLMDEADACDQCIFFIKKKPWTSGTSRTTGSINIEPDFIAGFKK